MRDVVIASELESEASRLMRFDTAPTTLSAMARENSGRITSLTALRAAASLTLYPTAYSEKSRTSPHTCVRSALSPEPGTSFQIPLPSGECSSTSALLPASASKPPCTGRQIRNVSSIRGTAMPPCVTVISATVRTPSPAPSPNRVLSGTLVSIVGGATVTIRGAALPDGR